MEYEPPVPFALIDTVFGAEQETVRNHAKKYATELNAVKSPVRPSTLRQEEVDRLVSIILDFFSQRQPLTLAEICSLVIQQFEKPITADTLCHFLHRDGRLKTCTAHPIDEHRLEVTSEQIQQYFADLLRLVSGAPVIFVFNVDEMGHQDWADAHEAACFVPLRFEDEQLFYPVS
jgi:transposase